MEAHTIAIIAGVFFTGGALLALAWAYKNRQFEDIEGIKYRMLKEEEGIEIGHGEVPLSLKVIIVLLVLWALVYLARNI